MKKVRQILIYKNVVIIKCVPIYRGTFVVSKRGKDWNARELLGHLLNGFLQYLQILVFRLIPDVVRRKITGPQNVVNVLYRTMEILKKKTKKSTLTKSMFHTV